MGWRRRGSLKIQHAQARRPAPLGWRRERVRKSCWTCRRPLLLLLAAVAWGQQIDVANGPNRQVRAGSLFNEIQDGRERKAFRELWETRDAAAQKTRAAAFVETYPRSVLLREAYEVGARALVAMNEDAAGLEWAKRSLRLLPENPFLLSMAANVAAKLGQYEWAADSARRAIEYLDRAAPPASLSDADWPRVRDGLRETAYFALGRCAAAAGKNREAEKWLVEALRLNPGDEQAVYALGVVRKSLGGDGGRAPAPVKQAALTNARYAGSEACRECHSAEYANWRQTGMAKMFRPYRAEDAIADFSGTPVVNGEARAVQAGDRRFIELRDDATGRWSRYAIDYLIGSKWQQAYATKLATGELLVLPIQYSRVEKAWVNYWKLVDGESARSDLGHFQGIPDGALYQRDCAPCHTSQLRYSAAAPESSTFREGGVDCEMCHGPSLGHAEEMRAGRKPSARPAAEPPVDFRRLAPEESVAICGQCHMQSAIHEPEAGGAVNYSDGGGAFYRTYRVHLLSDFTRKAFYADGRFKATTFIGEAFMRSRCFREGGATCVSCHNPHSSDAASNTKSLKFAPDSNEMCVQCHASMREHPEKHAHHAATSAASRCVTCHMPRNMDALLFRARSHQIDEIPDGQLTQRFGESASPNACLECHRDRGVEWVAGQLAEWGR